MSSLPSHEVVQPLSEGRRNLLFYTLLLLFIIAVPIFAFYATGYRYNVFAPDAVITATGGMYLSVPFDESETYLDEEPVRDSRVFRQALYLQSINPGIHRVHVQATGYQTWVKELPVYAHIVTEGAAFQMPEHPHLRPITQYINSAGAAVYLGAATTTDIVPFASTTLPLFATTTKATTTFTLNTEFSYIQSLFGTTTATSTPNTIGRVVDQARTILTPTATTTEDSTTTATTTIVMNDTILFERDGEVVVRFDGPERNIPYYFCIPEDVKATSSARYQAQLMAARLAYAVERGLPEIATTSTERMCRREVTMDRQGSEVISFQFFPGTTDLVLMHRKDGVVVTEVDDRAWQNTQFIYPSSADGVLVDGGRIYVVDDGRYFEILPELPVL